LAQASLGARVVEAVAAQDTEALKACFAPGVSLRALVPPGIRERSGAGEAAALVSGWFADARPLELVDSTAEVIGDRLHVSYRFSGIEDGEAFVVEQHWYCDVGEDRIERADLLCSGFRPPS